MTDETGEKGGEEWGKEEWINSVERVRMGKEEWKEILY